MYTRKPWFTCRVVVVGWGSSRNFASGNLSLHSGQLYRFLSLGAISLGAILVANGITATSTAGDTAAVAIVVVPPCNFLQSQVTFFYRENKIIMCGSYVVQLLLLVFRAWNVHVHAYALPQLIVNVDQMLLQRAFLVLLSLLCICCTCQIFTPSLRCDAT